MPNLEKIIANTQIETVVVTSATDLLSGQSDAKNRHIGSTQALEVGKGKTLKPRQIILSDIGVLQYTGVTTGVSKGAALSNASVISNAA